MIEIPFPGFSDKVSSGMPAGWFCLFRAKRVLRGPAGYRFMIQVKAISGYLCYLDSHTYKRATQQRTT